MSLFSVPKLRSVYYCSFLPSVFFNSNNILLLRLFFTVDTAFPNLTCLGREWGASGGDVGAKKRRRGRVGGKAGIYQLLRKIQRFKM